MKLEEEKWANKTAIGRRRKKEAQKKEKKDTRRRRSLQPGIVRTMGNLNEERIEVNERGKSHGKRC